MEVMRFQARGEIIVTSEGLLQIVRAHFDKISPAEWGMLANGIIDLETTNILLAMFVQLIQTLSVRVLQIVIPRDEVGVRYLNDTEANQAFQTITTVLQQSMGLIFGQALNIPTTQDVDQSNESQELTAIIETEVSQNVNRIMSVTSQEVEEIELRVASKMPTVHASRVMLSRAKHCLQMCLSALKCSCSQPEARTRSADSIYECKKGPCHSCFSVFARKNFKKMRESIDSKIMEACSATSSSSGSLRLSSPLKTPENEYDEIRRDVDEIFRQMNMVPSQGSSSSQQRIKEYLQSGDATTLLERLTDMMYDHFNVLGLHQNLTDPSGKACSDSALSSNLRQSSSFPVLNSFVEFEVGKFIKKLCNFMQQDPLDYLNNIDLFEICREQRSPDNPKFDIFERSMVHPMASVPSKISRDVPAIVLRTPPQKTEPSPIPVSPQSPPKPSPQTPKKSPQRSPQTEGQKMTETVVMELTRKVFKKVPISQRNEDDYKAFSDHLWEKALKEIDLDDHQSRKVGKNMSRVTADVMDSLKREYGSSKRATRALLSDRDAFEDTVVMYLQVHIDSALTKKSSVLSRAWTHFCKRHCCL